MTQGTIHSIVSNLLQIEVDGPVIQNEICYVKRPNSQLMAEVIKVSKYVFAQLFESSTELSIGDSVEFTGKMLEATLGPGILSQNYDGLQNNLETMPGIFIEAGQATAALDMEARFSFKGLKKKGDKVQAGEWIGEVIEGFLPHKIMIPFSWKGSFEIQSISDDIDLAMSEAVAEVKAENGEIHKVFMYQKWPVKKAIESFTYKNSPSRIFHTGLRVIDSLTPIAEGGTGFIPGAFGTGKTVLQQAIAKNNDADIVILVACGERANEVVEIFTEFPELEDLRTGRKLKEKTCIVCNTSNMPVASRETSVYLGMTLAEYYRNMGHKVLLLADSTSRWAQALREMSNRMEEMPGTDAFPVELPATIAQFYSRAGEVVLHDGSLGSVTFLGTVSPAGGNFKEPVTESTGKVARAFYALSQKRADSKRYPAIDPLLSYSRYLDYPDFQRRTDKEVENGWTKLTIKAKSIIQNGIEAREQISILGDDGVPLEYHSDFWRSELLDFAFVQQDSFDDEDMNTPMDRQVFMLKKLLKTCGETFQFSDHSDVSRFYKKLINAFRQMNYVSFRSDKFIAFEKEYDRLVDEQSQTQESLA